MFAKLYTKTHEWLELTGSIGIVGITIHSANNLGEIVCADVLPGRKANHGHGIGDIESVKDSIVMFTPVTGTVIEVNPRLRDNPELINAAPETEGWIAKVQISDPLITSTLLDRAAYKRFLSANSH
jgi:glycine cleavage system H protein